MATVTCALCLVAGAPRVRQVRGLRIEFCPACGGGRIHAAKAPSEMLAPEAENRMRFRGYHERMARWRLASLRARAPVRRLVEVGSATGEFQDAARRAGLEPVGLERCAATRAIAARRYPGLDLRGEDPDQLVPPEGGYDAVVAFHVFEHVEDLEGFLAGCRALLGAEGVLHLRVPYHRSAFAWLAGGGWPGFVLDHRWLFTPEGLRPLLARAGFQVEHLATDGYPGTSMLVLLPTYWRFGGRTLGQWLRGLRGRPESGPASEIREVEAPPGEAFTPRDRVLRALSWGIRPLQYAFERAGLGEELVVTARRVSA